MYRQDERCEVPSNPKTNLWRYMNFTKFISLLEQSALYFCSPFAFDDPFECTFPLATRSKNEKKLREIMKKDYVDNYSENSIKNVLSRHQKYLRKITGSIRINCWHMRQYESDPMWRLYARDGEGVAIRTTFLRLCNCFHKAKEDVSIGEVKYIDFATYLPSDAAFEYGPGPALLKRKGFEAEREVRAIIKQQRNNGHGIYVPVDLNRLILSVHVAPTAPEWFVTLVQSTLQRHKLHKHVFHSELHGKPYW